MREHISEKDLRLAATCLVRAANAFTVRLRFLARLQLISLQLNTTLLGHYQLT